MYRQNLVEWRLLFFISFLNRSLPAWIIADEINVILLTPKMAFFSLLLFYRRCLNCRMWEALCVNALHDKRTWSAIFKSLNLLPGVSILYGPMTFVKRCPCVLRRADGLAQERQPDNHPTQSAFNYLLVGGFRWSGPFPEIWLYKRQDTWNHSANWSHCLKQNLWKVSRLFVTSQNRSQECHRRWPEWEL